MWNVSKGKNFAFNAVFNMSGAPCGALVCYIISLFLVCNQVAKVGKVFGYLEIFWENFLKIFWTVLNI